MRSVWFKRAAVTRLKFLQIKDGWPDFLVKRIQEILVSLLYFNFKSFKDVISSSIIRFQCILLDWGVPFSYFINLYKLKRKNLISGGRGAILQKTWVIWSPVLHFSFKNFRDPNSFSFIRFQCIFYVSEELLSDFWNFSKLEREDLVSGGNIIWIICSRFHPLPPSSGSSFLRFRKFLQNKERKPNFWRGWGTNSADTLNYFVPNPFCI